MIDALRKCARFTRALAVFALATGAAVPIAAASDLTVEIVTAYNFVVDSNVETPATYGPKSAYIGAKFCNTGTNDLTDVFAYIGEFDGREAGIYPAVTNPQALIGTFSLTHEGGSVGRADATRYIGTIPAGGCSVQYWLVSYPQLDDNGDTVTGGIKPDDDLVLEYDVWIDAFDDEDGDMVVDPGESISTNDTRTATMRNEISASANKIWPNGDNKVPNEYVDAINEVLGWDTVTPSGSSSVFPGQKIITQGIWYDMGVPNQGFDNNGDFVPDQNAWMQPVGDPSLFDAGCFRLIRSFGIVIVKFGGGTEFLIPFENQLYFEGIPKNVGTVGLVFYEFAAKDGVCNANVTPYQEVASGFDNEKFSSDFGVSIPPLQSTNTSATVDKSGTETVIPGDIITYTITVTNPGPGNVGGKQGEAMDFVISDTYPTSVFFVANTAETNNTVPGGATNFAVLYSTNSGANWDPSEPPNPTNITDVQWVLDSPLQSGSVAVVEFQVQVPTNFMDVEICNTAQLQIGFGPPMTASVFCTRIQGCNAIEGTAFEDTGAGPFFGNRNQDAGEAAITNANVTLYFDADGDGSGDSLWGMDVTDASGFYEFTNLPDGAWVIQIEPDLADAQYDGWINTTFAERSIQSISMCTTNGTNNFGFSPALEVIKTCDGNPSQEGQIITYTITVENHSAGVGVGGQSTALVSSVSWASTNPSVLDGDTSSDDFNNPENATGDPDGAEADHSANWPSSASVDYQDILVGSGFEPIDQCGDIVKVEALYSFRVTDTNLLEDDTAALFFFDARDGDSVEEFEFEVPLEDMSNMGSTATFAWDVTTNIINGAPVTERSLWDGSGTNTQPHLGIIGRRVGSSYDGADIFVDSIGVRITVSNCGAGASSPSTTLDPLPVVDTYDTNYLSFVTASITPDTIDTTNGRLVWDNVGPLFPQATTNIEAQFTVIRQSGNTGFAVTNHAAVTNATFADGTPASESETDRTNDISATGFIDGYLYSDTDGDGWQAPDGYETGTDLFIPNVIVSLHECDSVSGGGNCVGESYLRSTTTDTNGYYFFSGLETGRVYFVVVNPTSIVGYVDGDQTGDPDDDADRGSGGNGGTCGNGGQNAACNNEWSDDLLVMGNEAFGGDAWNYTNINFGYDLNPGLFGNLWADMNCSGSQDAGDNALTNVTIELQDGACVPGSTCVTTNTDENGYYEFTSLTAGTAYTVVVDVATLPTNLNWGQTVDPDATLDDQHEETLAASEIDGPFDFAYCPTGLTTIGDTVYVDWNGDGVQDPGDEGIPGVSLSLYEDANCDGVVDTNEDALIVTLIGSDVTDADGMYLFSNVFAGCFIVLVEESDIPIFHFQTADPDEPLVTCATCDIQATTTVDGVTADLTIDYGYQPFGNAFIGDTVWLDLNADGVQAGVSEVGISNITVSLYADLNDDGTYVLVSNTVTDASGFYIFTNLPNGEFRVDVDLSDPDLPEDPFGNTAIQTTSNQYVASISNQMVGSLNFSACTACELDADFGFALPGAIGDTIYYDANFNGQLDYTEAGIPDVTVYLCDTSTVPCGAGNAIATNVTADGTATNGTPAGFYIFTGLSPDFYKVVVDTNSLPVGLEAGDLTADPDADGVPCTNLFAPECDGVQYDIEINYGTYYMGADFGYQPLGVIGDYVWFDQDGDGVQDAGEPGIFNATVCVYNASLVTNECKQTDADGEYLFFNLPDGTYTVVVDSIANRSPTFDADGGADLTSIVIITSGIINSNINLWATNADASLDVDFGFELDGDYCVEGTICIDDATEDGVCASVDDIEIGGMPVYLYNDGGEYLGSTLTDTNGNYAFTNLIDDNYILAVPTTVPPLPGTRLTTTVSDTPATNITETALSTYQIVPISGSCEFDVDFAFVLTNNFDWGDLPTSYNTQLTDMPDGPRHIIPSLTNLFLGASLDTETDGQPSTLADGDGGDEDGITVVDLEDWHNGSGGGRLNVEVNGSGWLVGWIDFNGDGDLFDAGELIIDQAVTAGIISNRFDIPLDTFATNSMTNLYARFRLLPSEPPIAEFSFLGEQFGGEVEDYFWTNIGNGFTYAMLHDVRAEVDGGDVWVAWDTSVEIDTAGFYVERREDGHTSVRIHDELIPALYGEPQGGTYRVLDTGAQPGQPHRYILTEVETGGREVQYGPYRVTAAAEEKPIGRGLRKSGKKGVGAGGPALLAKSLSSSSHGHSVERRARPSSAKRQARTEKRRQRQAEESLFKKSLTGNLIKLPLTEERLYYISAEELAKILDLKTGRIRKLIRKGQLEVREQGEMVRYIPADKGKGLYLYGKGQESIFTDEQVYWFGVGNAMVMDAVNGGSPVAVTAPQTFTESIHAEENNSALTALFSDPLGDFWLWNTLLAGHPSIGTRTYSVEVCGVAPGAGTAQIRVHLHGITDTGVEAEHHAVVQLNGEQIGEGMWSGKTPHTLELDVAQDKLLEGTNIITLIAQLDAGVSFSAIAMDAFDVEYERIYEAKGDSLRFNGEDNAVITVSGFTEEEIIVLDVTDEHAPKVIHDLTLDEDGGSYRVSFSPEDSDRSYLACAVGAVSTDTEPLAAQATTLMDAKNRADYIVITPGELAVEAQALADHRATQGHEVMLVELQTVYDAFGYGESTPLAIKEFLSYAYTYWELPPTYAVFIGTGTYDYKDHRGYGDNLVPTLLVSAPSGLFGSDMQFGDVVGSDGVPEIAIGRIPVLTATELTTYIDKLIAYEKSDGGDWADDVVMLADNPDMHGNFTSHSESLSEKLASGYQQEKVYLENETTSSARGKLTNAINAGAVFVNYAGHGSMDRMADEGLMVLSDVDGFTNSYRTPVVLALTCILGRYEVPGFDTLGEKLVTHEGGGAAAVWSPTGLSINYLARFLSEEFYKALAEDEDATLGELILRACEAYKDIPGAQDYMLYIYNLLGDPALKLKDVTALE